MYLQSINQSMFPQSTAARQPYRVLEVLLHPAQGAAGGTQQGRLRGSQVCTIFARASILQIGSHFLIFPPKMNSQKDLYF